MPVNRNALIRYKTLDKCLQNRYRKWTLEDLIDAVSDALYEYEGIDKGVSKRTVQADIQMMRSDKLGYNAPIIVTDKKYYSYEDRDYSITNIPLTDQDLGSLSEAVAFLKQFKGFSHFRELDSMISKLEDHVYAHQTHQHPVIDFEKNENLKGIQLLDELYQAIIKKRTLSITYQSFKAKRSNSFTYYPYYLKEYRNRWFLIGAKKGDTGILTLALDRIQAVEPVEEYYEEPEDFDVHAYYKDVIGVTVNAKEAPREVHLFVDSRHAPYILTKPIHHSQEVIEEHPNGVTIAFKVQLNFELERVILGYGDGVKVIKPASLRRRLMEQHAHALDLYQSDINAKSLDHKLRQLDGRGFTLLPHIYTKKEVDRMRAAIHKHCLERYPKQKDKLIGIRNLLAAIPEFRHFLFNRNLVRILEQYDKELFLTKAMYFNKPPQANWYVTWHQDRTVHVKQKKVAKGYKGWTHKDGMHAVCPPEEIIKATLTVRIHLDDTTEQNGALRVIPGSQNKYLTDKEIALITGNSADVVCEMGPGGVMLMKPLLLHASSKTKNQKQRRLIHLEFCSKELANGLEWAERFVW